MKKIQLTGGPARGLIGGLTGGLAAGLLMATPLSAQDVAPPMSMEEPPTWTDPVAEPPEMPPNPSVPPAPMPPQPAPGEPIPTDPWPMEPAPPPTQPPTAQPPTAQPPAGPVPPAPPSRPGMMPDVDDGRNAPPAGQGITSEPPVGVDPAPGVGSDGAADILRGEGFSALDLKNADNNLGLYTFRANRADGELVLVYIDVTNGRYWIHPVE